LTSLRALIVALALLIALPTYADGRKFEFQPTDGQAIEYASGQQIVVASGAFAVVHMVFVPESNRAGWLHVSVRNLDNTPFTVQETSLVASTGDSALKTYTYDDLIKAQKRKENWRQTGAALAAGMNGYAAGMQGTSYTTGSYSGTSTATAYGSGGTATAYGRQNGSFSSVTYDPAVQAAAIERANQKAVELQSQLDAAKNLERAQLDQRVLRANTVRPGADVAGQIRVDLPKPSKDGAVLNVTFKAGPETFHFSLIERR